MIVAVADTHAALRYLFNDPRLSAVAVDSMKLVSRVEVPAMPDRIVAATGVASRRGCD